MNTLVNQATWDSGKHGRWAPGGGGVSASLLLHAPSGWSWDLGDLVSPGGGKGRSAGGIGCRACVCVAVLWGQLSPPGGTAGE